MRTFLNGATPLLLTGLLMLGGCASLHPGQVTPPPLRNAISEVQVDDVDILEVTPAMEAFLDRYVLKYSNPQTRLELLTMAVTRAGVLSFHYDETRTLTASEAFETRSGNCIGFANMMIALAREAGLDAHYQEVFIRPEWSDFADDTVLLVKHVNVVIETPRMSWVVDVSGITIRPSERRRIIEDSYAKALYLNNIAVESLLENDLPTAYAYMRSAIEADSRASDPWVNLGVVFGRNGQLDDAIFAFNRALNIDSSEYSALSNLYEVYVVQENLESAAQLASKVERYRRNNPYYLLKLSDEALEHQKYEESISLLQSAIKKKDDDHKLLFALAKTQYLSGELAAAQNSLLRARELAPKDMVAYYDRPLNELITDQ
ncbi:MAG TPA: transglutaminase domain-containing protein [Xanthomonadales bacterium]